MYMSGSHPAVDYEAVQYDVDLGGGDSSSGGEGDDDEVREQLLAKRSKLTNYDLWYQKGGGELLGRSQVNTKVTS